MFKPHWGNCKECPPNETKLIVTRNGLCKYHNEQLKDKNKKPKEPKDKKPSRATKPNYGNCSCCGQPGLIVVKSGLRHQCNEKKKREAKAKSNRIVKLVNKAERKKSYPALKKQLWEVFSEYIRCRDSRDGMFVCISCGKLQSTENGNLQAGHYYKSQVYPAIRYNEIQVNGQCKSCNIFKEGNRQGYEIGLLKKYGQAALDKLKLQCHNKIRLGRFELELLIKEYTQKLDKLKTEKQNGSH